MKKIVVLGLILIFSISCKKEKPSTIESAEHKKEDILWTVDYSPDNTLFAVGGNYDSLYIYNTGSNSIFKKYFFSNTITRAIWHPKDSLIGINLQVSQNKPGILNLSTSQFIQLDSISVDGARGMAWSPSGDKIAVGDNDGYLSLFSNMGRFEKRIKVDPKGITDLDWNPDGKTIALVGSQIALYSLDSDEVKVIVDMDEQTLHLSVNWHPSGEFFTSGDYGNIENNINPILSYWSKDGQFLNAYDKGKAPYRNIYWNKEGSSLYTASDGLRIFNSEGNLLKHIPTTNKLWGIDIVEDQNGLEKVLVTSKKGEILLINSESGTKEIIK
ncbi:WD40 repeat domain-containing protein [Aegicerativicinus sediminis]